MHDPNQPAGPSRPVRPAGSAAPARPVGSAAPARPAPLDDGAPSMRSSSPVRAPSRAQPGAAQALPPMSFGTEPVDPNKHIASGTNLYTLLGYGVVGVGLLIFAISTMGFGLLLLPIGWLIQRFQAKKIRAMIRGSGVQVTAQQLPELHALVDQFAARLGMKSAPEVYIVEENVQNGFAVKLGKKNLLLLTDDMIWGSLQSGEPRSLGFVVGHELAHVALGHTGIIRSMLSTAFRPLARADEFTCDNVGSALVGDSAIAVRGLSLLLVGPQLLPYINDDALMQQAKEVCADKQSKKSEQILTHPLLLRRVGSLLGYIR